MSIVSDLWSLQETDSALDARRASLEDAQSRLGETDAPIALRARVDALRGAHRAAASTQKDIDLEAEQLKSKIAPAEKKLYSGAIKNPKELADLQADIDSMKRHLAAIEDRDLEALATLETAETELRSATSELEDLEAAWQKEQADLRDRVARLSGEISVYEQQRDDRAECVAPDLLKRYIHLRRVHQGKAVAKLDRNLCLGCRISLPVSTVNRARSGNTLVQCPNCERILFA